MKKSILITFSLVLTLNAQNLKTNINELLSTNPTIIERLKNFNATNEDITNAKAGFYPKLDLSLGMGIENTHKTEQVNSAPDITTAFSVYQNSLKLTQNIFNGFKTTSLINEQKLRALSAAYSYVEKVNDTSLEFASAYLDVLKNYEILQTAQENVTIDQDIFNKVQKLYHSGLTTLSEVNKVQASLAQAKANLVIKENTLLNTQYNMQKLLGRYTNVKTMQKPTFKINIPATLQETIEYALGHNPTLIVGKYNTKLAQETYREKKASFYPQIDLEVSQSLSKNRSAIEAKNSVFSAMAYLKYNIFNGYADTAELQKSLSQIHQEVASTNKLRREIIESISISWASYTKLTEQLVHLKEYKKFSKKTLSLYKKEYDLGRRSLLDLLSAQSDFIGAKSQIISTEYTILSSKYELLDGMGTLVSSILGDTSKVTNRVGLSDTQKFLQKDTLPIRLDRDKDLIVAAQDICDNSLSSSMKNLYGCTFRDTNISSIERYDNFHFNNDINATFSEQTQIRATNLIKQLTPYGLKNIKIDLLVNAHDINRSQAKAKTFTNFLTMSGVADANITTIINNNTAPMYIGDEAKNSRVDVIVYKFHHDIIQNIENNDSNTTTMKEVK